MIKAFFIVFMLQFLQIDSSAKSLCHDSLPNEIHEERFVMINGIQQWISIQGNSKKPAILFLHGGPGSPLSPYSASIYGNWEKDFLLIQWDQRGAGKTYGYNAPAELTPTYLQANPLKIEEMVADGIALSKYLLKYLGKDKLILLATSWGSVLGVYMATKKSRNLLCLYWKFSNCQSFGRTDPRLSKSIRPCEDGKRSAILECFSQNWTPTLRYCKKCRATFENH